MDNIEIVSADLDRIEHQNALLSLMDLYARDPMQGGEPLPANVLDELIPELRKHPAKMIWLAYRGAEAVGFTVCFLGFSTFAARPLINIHDISVRADCRGLGVGKLLMETIEAKARELRCCKITLEVREDNDVARGLYRKLGFDRSNLGAQKIPMEFWQKKL
ncbi:MAG: GNAT family N-acetyltransferase [Candidatus Binatus sp.]|uniref:GNAT family N-acetyltransferase n=1 Tax=Candidatus Binatus sp. TaxID=2811406 RepID=UPI0027287965|nr:GNAT family N-acetyltransferase [Candidatus Binatus sp.]MDO8432937.1 GNAT family N-acetyltransferase [Candidatus Binatus sp.]